MLELLARSAWAGSVAADRLRKSLALDARRKLGLRNVERGNPEARQDRTGSGIDIDRVIVARKRVDVLGNELRKLERRRLLELDLGPHQDARHFFADRDEQALEQQEGLLLVLVDRLLLRVAAKVDN